MNLLDWLLIAVVLAYALSGYWQGFVTGAFATTGLLLGGLLGVWLAPIALGDADPSLLVSLGALFIVILSASLGQGLFQFVGARIRDRITWQPARAIDAVGGAALSAAAVLVVAWALGVAISGSRIGGITGPVRSSAVLGQVNEVMPEAAGEFLDAFNDVVGTTFFPRYLEPFAPERIVEVSPGDERMLARPRRRARRRVGAQDPRHQRLRPRRRGHGLPLRPGPADDQRARRRRRGRPRGRGRRGQHPRDRRRVRPRARHRRPRVRQRLAPAPGVQRPATPAKSKDAVAILGYPEDGPYDVRAGRIRDQQRLSSPDIYGDGKVIRDVYSVRGLVRPGNSGGPIVTSGGEAVGVVFAASVTDEDTGYALTSAAVAQAAALGVTSDSAVDTGDCAR